MMHPRTILNALFASPSERPVARIGFYLALCIATSLMAISWWVFRSQRELEIDVTRGRTRELGSILSDYSERLLQQGDLSTLRSTITDFGQRYGLTSRIRLTDGSIIASTEPTEIDAIELAERWPAQVQDGESVSSTGAETDAWILRVENRGSAILEIVSAPSQFIHVTSSTLSGIGFIGGITLLGLLVIYRRLRLRLAGFGAISGALSAFHDGERDRGCLSVMENHDLDTTAWNELVQQFSELRHQDLVGEMLQTIERMGPQSSELSSAVDVLWHGIMLIDRNLTIQYANGAAGVLLHARSKEMVGRNLQDAVPSAAILDLVENAVKSGGSMPAFTEVDSRKDGSMQVLRVVVRPVYGKSSSQVLVLVEDVTKQRLAEESRNSFVAQAVHELRNPLTNMQLYVEEVLDAEDDDRVTRKRGLTIITHEIKRLNRIVGDMLSVAELEAGTTNLRCDNLKFEEMIQDVERDFMATALEKKVDLTVALPPKMPVIRGDRDKLVLVLHNIVGNAIKYTPEGGTVHVEIEPEGDVLSVEVADTGIGMSEEDQKRVFERFYRAADPRLKDITGSGLGLALAREIIQLHGGEIVLESELNKGSRFKIKIPTYSAAA